MKQLQLLLPILFADPVHSTCNCFSGGREKRWPDYGRVACIAFEMSVSPTLLA